MTQDDAGSAPMLGSREPAAWMWRESDDDPMELTESRKMAESVASRGCVVVPLHRYPAIADEELEAIANGASSLEAEAMREGLSINATAYMRKHAATLRGLLARLS